MKKADLLGIFTSFICLLHCLAVPVFFSIQPMLSRNFEFVWEGLDYIFMLISLVAIYFSLRHTRNVPIKIGFVLFYVILVGGLIFEKLEESWEWISYVGMVGLITMHFMNSKSYHFFHKHKKVTA